MTGQQKDNFTRLSNLSDLGHSMLEFERRVI